MTLITGDDIVRRRGYPPSASFTPPLAAWRVETGLLEGDLGEAAELAAMQLIDSPVAQQFDGPHADAQMLVDPLSIEMVRHAGQLDLAVQRLVADAQQRAVRHAAV